MLRGLGPRQFAKELWGQISRNRTFDLAAQFAYWSLLALFPFAIFLLTIIGYVPLHGLDEQVLDIVNNVMPAQAAALFEHTLREVIGRQRGWLLLFALVGSVWSATGGMASTLTALNRAYGVQETRPWWKRKLLCIAMTVGAALAMIVSTAAMLIGPQLVHSLMELLGLGGAFDVIWRWVRWPIVVGGLLFALALVYYFLPNVKQRFRAITPGSVIAVGLWVIVSSAFNAYVSHFHSYAKTYGTLGTAVVLMTWLYLTGLVVILGGEINAVLDRQRAVEQTAKETPPVVDHAPA
ncbi:MAG TPA: YihY/virulence factor BrkB family protein [Polyangia bacterium]|nr:YihY/virulence factor BrkB family protein [Polyangia bacterium]